jgi:hypothetical protein
VYDTSVRSWNYIDVSFASDVVGKAVRCVHWFAIIYVYLAISHCPSPSTQSRIKVSEAQLFPQYDHSVRSGSTPLSVLEVRNSDISDFQET